MKHLKGYRKQYYKLSIIAMYSTLNKLCTIDSNFVYHKKAFEYDSLNKDPPNTIFNYN